MTPLLFVLLALQTQPDHDLVCLSDRATGDVEVAILQRDPGGDWRHRRDDGQWAPPEMERRPEAQGLDWYEAGEPIVRDGIVYRPHGQTFSPGGAVNRYLRHVGLHEGAPLFSLWPGGDRDLAVLVSQKGCVFRVYDRSEG